MPAAQAVCFDLDGTLCVRDRDDERIHELLFERVDGDPSFGIEDVYTVDRDALPSVDTPAEYWEAYYRQVAENVGADPAQAPELAEATVEILVDDPQVSFRDGAEAALERAREDHSLALVTHGSERAQTAKLERLGIEDAFDATVFCGPTEPCPGKPDPEPFRRAVEALDARPERTLYVGDHLDGDVAGANAAGLRSVWVADGETPDDPEPAPDHVLASMDELSDLLRTLDAG